MAKRNAQPGGVGGLQRLSHHTRALNGAGINATIEDSSYGHFLSSLADEDAPEDYAWWWNLYVGMKQESSGNPQTWAWTTPLSRSYRMGSFQRERLGDPAPTAESSDETVCNGHGWEMGSGASKHCMCDAGYTWAEGTR